MLFAPGRPLNGGHFVTNPGDPPMSTEANKTLIRRMIDRAINERDLEALDEFLAPDFVSHEALPPGVPPGRESVKQLFSMMRSAFPDLQATVEDQIAEGDKVVARLTFSGTQQGDFMGVVPPTGRRVAYGVIDTFRIADEQVVEHWGVADIMGLMQQLGVGPGAEGGNHGSE
jgi:predicted ester cyclase